MIKKIYFIGIKGVGMMGLSIIAKQAGIAVAGSDISEEFITDKVLADHNINVYIGFKKENIDDYKNTSKSKHVFLGFANVFAA